MGKQTEIKFNLDGLNNLSQALKDSYVTRVGILGWSGNVRYEGVKDSKTGKNKEGNSGSEMTNAEIGVIHEFGIESKNIKARSFLRLPLEIKRRELMKAFASGSTKKAIETGDYKKVFEFLGLKAEEIIQEAFESGGFGHWPALDDSTVAAKGSSAILIDTGQLRRAITSDVVKKGSL